MFIKQFVATQNLATDAKDYTLEKLSNEQGEVASWMIVLAGLVIAGIYAKDEIGSAIEGLVDDTKGKIDGASN